MMCVSLANYYPQRPHLLDRLDAFRRSFIWPKQVSLRGKEFVSRPSAPENAVRSDHGFNSIGCNGCSTYSFIELKAIWTGIFPNIPSIIAKCSRFSWVWNVASPVKSSNRMQPTLHISQGYDHPSPRRNSSSHHLHFLLYFISNHHRALLLGPDNVS